MPVQKDLADAAATAQAPDFLDQKTRKARGRDGSDSRMEILNAARRVLIEDGYPHFTLRRISSLAQIHLKTLQHYFGGKRELLLETVNYTIDNFYYQGYFSVLRDADSDGHESALSKAFQYLIQDVKTKDSTFFFFELWALASRDEDARDALDVLYTRHRHHLELLITRANPRLAGKTVRLRATMMAAQIEGLALFIGYGKPQHPEFEQLAIEAHDRLLAYALAR